MNKVFRKYFWKQSILTAVIIALTVTGTGNVSLAAEMPEDGWYQPKYHSDLDYSEMEYTGFDRTKLDEAIRVMDRICSSDSADSAGQEDRVMELYDIMVSEIDLLNTQATLNDLTYYKDVHNEEAQEESQKLGMLTNELGNSLCITLKNALDSPYGSLLREKIGEDGIEQLEDFHPMTDREFELTAQELSLIQEYDQASVDSYTVLVDGEEWTTERFAEEEPEDEEESYEIFSALTREKNSVAGEIYKEMIQVRNEIAREKGYDNYADYAYKEVYGRDFTTEEIKQVYEEVKEWLVPLYSDVLTAQLMTDVEALYEAGDGKTGEEILEELEPYFGKIHPDLTEAYAYMRAHHLYDIEMDDDKMDIGFTANLYSYGVPFIFNDPYGTYGDYSTVIHEFGHYNQMFHCLQPSLWEQARMDVYEIHSQGLEMLFYPYADDIFGEGGDAFRYETVGRMLYGVREGCLYDAFQNAVYKNPDMSLEEINRTFLKLAKEYGYEYPDDTEQAYGWVEVPHTFESPMYYIGYATSALSSLDIWLESLDNREEAVNKYMHLSALGGSLPYRKVTEECGLEDIFGDGVIAGIAEAVRTAMDVDDKLAEYDRTVSRERRLRLAEVVVGVVIGFTAVLLIFLLVTKKRRKRMAALAQREKAGDGTAGEGTADNAEEKNGEGGEI